MAGRKRKKSATSNYLISTGIQSMNQLELKFKSIKIPSTKELTVDISKFDKLALQNSKLDMSVGLLLKVANLYPT